METLRGYGVRGLVVDAVDLHVCVCDRFPEYLRLWQVPGIAVPVTDSRNILSKDELSRGGQEMQDSSLEC